MPDNCALTKSMSSASCPIGTRLLLSYAAHGIHIVMKQFSEQMAEFDARIRSAGVSYRRLGRIAGIQPANLSRYRQGGAKPSMEQWVRMNNALDALIAERIRELREAS